jgi:uncharacterized Zn finger protein
MIIRVECQKCGVKTTRELIAHKGEKNRGQLARMRCANCGGSLKRPTREADGSHI